MSSDEERQHALASFKAKLIESREWEAKLKALRLEIKGLQKDFDQTEENIKALQSVGQIIGEVLKQLDDERCELFHPGACHTSSRTQHFWRINRILEMLVTDTILYSHRQGFIRSQICRRLQVQSRQDQAKAGNTCCAGHDDSDDYAHAPP